MMEARNSNSVDEK